MCLGSVVALEDGPVSHYILYGPMSYYIFYGPVSHCILYIICMYRKLINELLRMIMMN